MILEGRKCQFYIQNNFWENEKLRLFACISDIDLNKTFVNKKANSSSLV